jgi:hypothetical protein
MKQLIPRVDSSFGYAAATQYYAISAGDDALPVNASIARSRIPVPIAGTFRNLKLLCTSIHPTYTVTLMVNGVASTLTATLLSTEEEVQDTDHDVVVVAGDLVAYKVVGSTVAYPGFSAGTCIEFEGAESIYGINCNAAVVAIGGSIFGGALGNGQQESFGAPGTQLSETYSICAANGNITAIRAYANTIGAGGSWAVRIRKNGITQDGAGGTVDTTCTITDPAQTGNSAFTLPVVIGDHIDIISTRLVTSHTPSSAPTVSACIAFTPTTAGEYMLCGGSNDSLSATVDGYKWVRSRQLELPEYSNAAPIGSTGLRARGLYVERDGVPGVGKSVVYTLRKNATDTDITFSIADSNSTGFVIDDVSFVDGDRIDIEASPVNTPGNNPIHWGLTVDTAAEPPPPDPNPGSGVFILVPGLKHDFDETPIEVLVRTPLIGD